MDNKEAIQFLDELLLMSDFIDQHGDTEDSSPYEEAVEIARQAIEKQIPQKLKTEILQTNIQGYINMDKCYVCPLCGIFRGNADYQPEKIIKYQFCPNCGQALDWSDKN